MIYIIVSNLLMVLKSLFLRYFYKLLNKYFEGSNTKNFPGTARENWKNALNLEFSLVVFGFHPLPEVIPLLWSKGFKGKPISLGKSVQAIEALDKFLVGIA